MIATNAMTAINHALRYHSSEAARGAEVAGTASSESGKSVEECFHCYHYHCYKFISYFEIRKTRNISTMSIVLQMSEVGKRPWRFKVKSVSLKNVTSWDIPLPGTDTLSLGSDVASCLRP